MTTKERLYGNIVKDKIYLIKQFDYLGLNKHYTGYFMLIDLVTILLEGKIKAETFSKKIYPIVAKKFNKTECTVERNIRNLIDKCWTETLIEKLGFLENRSKPTCRDFVFTIKNYIEKQIL